MCPLFVPQIYNQTASSSSVVVGLPFLFSSLSEVTTTILGLKVGGGAGKRGAGGEASKGGSLVGPEGRDLRGERWGLNYLLIFLRPPSACRT